MSIRDSKDEREIENEARRILILEARMEVLYQRAAKTTKIGEATRLHAEYLRMRRGELPFWCRGGPL